MSAVVADTHVLLWMLRGSLRERSELAADAVESALTAHALHVSVGSFLDLRYLVDSGRFQAAVLDRVRSVVDGDAFRIVPLDLPLVTADETIQGAIGGRALW